MFITCMLHNNYYNKKLTKGSMVNIKLPFDVFLCNLNENNMKRKRMIHNAHFDSISRKQRKTLGSVLNA